ncbi:MAG TPA: ATP-binding protein [Mycobacteriales bacterium]|nr:ATP-binding protein [Mycobacteriales bacterium]
MPATGSRVARNAFARLMARCAAGLRVGSAVAAGTAAFAGLDPPASAALVAVAVAGAATWSVGYAVVLWRRPVRVPVGLDVALTAALCLGQGRLVAAGVLAGSTSWVFLFASTTVIISPLVARSVVGAAVAVAVPAAYVVGLELAPGAGAPGSAVLLVVQGVLVTALVTVLRRAAAAADLAVVQREATERQAAVQAARRAEERESYRTLHDSVSATLTVVAAGGISRRSMDLRRQARRDVEVIERLNAPDGPAPDGSPPVPDGAAPGAAAPGGPAGGVGVAGGGSELAGWLYPVVAGAAVAVTLEAPIPAVPVPPAAGAALAGALSEALTNVVRHAGPARVRLAATAADGTVTVELTDDGRGFDPAAVPASCRGVRESLVGRMRAVDGSATVNSRPGDGTGVLLRWPGDGTGVLLRWPAAGPTADPDGAPGSPAGLGDVIAARYRRGMDLVVILLVGSWHASNDLVAVVSRWPDYRWAPAEAAAWLALAAIGVAGGVRLWRRRTGRAGTWALAAAALGAGAVGTAGVPGPALFTAAGWAWGAVGWFGVLLLLRRPPRELVGFLAINSAVAVAVLAHDGELDRIGLARAATAVYGPAALQLTLLLAARAVAATARSAAALAAAEAGVRRRRQIADRLHADRRRRYGMVRRSVTPLLTGLAEGTLDPADRGVRHACAVEASRLRRLFAETDDVAEPLLHELRACSYIADQRGVVVDLQTTGRLPRLDRDARRALTELPLLALAGAERHARITVLARSDEVAVSVLVDGSGPPPGPAAEGPGVAVTVMDGTDRQWVEARWRR